MSRYLAQCDLRIEGAEVRQVDDRVFTVSYPRMDIFEWADSVTDNKWRGMRTTGTNPTLHDTGDPQTLAEFVTYQHDYPSADMLGHYTTENN